MPRKPVFALFFPERALQGATVPGFLRWQAGGALERLTLTSTVGITVAQVHNGKLQQHDTRTATLEQAEAVPYIGFVLRFGLIDGPKANAIVTFEGALKDGTKLKETRSIALYRPLLDVVETPERLKVQVKSSGVEVEPRIRIQNLGEGTAVVSFHRSESRLEPSTMMAEFQRGFLKDLLTRLPGLVVDHPKHKGHLEAFPGMIFSVTDVRDTSRLKDLDIYLTEVSEAMNNDEPYARDFADAVIWAFTRNFQQNMLMQQFVEYMRSLGGSKVILVNPLDTVELKAGANEVTIEVAQTDLERTAMDPIVLSEVEVVCTEAMALPVHKLFRFEEVRL